MADNDWKKRLGVVFSTNPDFTYEEEVEDDEDVETEAEISAEEIPQEQTAE